MKISTRPDKTTEEISATQIYHNYHDNSHLTMTSEPAMKKNDSKTLKI